MKKKLLTKALGVLLGVSMALSGMSAYAAETGPEATDVQSDTQKEDDVQEEETFKQGILNGDAGQEDMPADMQQPYSFDGNEEYLKSGDVFAFNWKKATDDEINHVCGVTDDMMLGEWLLFMDAADRQELLEKETMFAGDYQICEPSMDSEDEDADADADEDVSGLKEGGCYAEYLMAYAKKNAGARANYWNGSTGYYDKEIYVDNTLKYAWRVKVEIYTDSSMSNGANKTEVGEKNWCKYTFVSKSGSLNGTGIAVSLDASQYVSMAKNSANDDSYIYIVPKWSMTVPTGYAVVNTLYNGTSATGAGYARQTYLASQTSISSYVVTLSGNPFVTSAYGAGSLLLRDHIRATAYLSNGYHSGSENGTVKAGSLVQRYYFAPATYYVDYDGNGATGGTTARSVVTYGTPQSVAANGFTKAYTVTYNANKEDVASPAPSVATAAFTGWTDAAGKEVTSLYNLTGTNGGVITLKANWRNGSVTLPTLSKSGYMFGGWSTAQGIRGANTAYTPMQNETVRAQWTANTYTVRYDLQQGKSAEGGLEQEPTVFTYDVEGMLAPAPIWDGHIFNGWRINGAVYSAGQNVKNLATEGELTAEAQWDEIPVPIPIPTPTPDPNDETVKTILEAIQNGSAFQLTVDGTDYTIVRGEDGTLSIQVASIPAGTQVLTIPSEVKIGDSVYTITEIYKECFKGNTDLREVTVGNNITKIGDSAFKGCTNLKKLHLAEGLITIGNNAFEGCSSLTSIKTPSTLQTIGDYAFCNCVTLKTVTLNNGLLTIGSYAFYNCKMVAKIVIPDTVLKIGKYAFGKCVKLKTVTASKSCATMGTGVFSNCSALTKITLKTALRAVPKKAFYNCKRLQTVKMENKVATIGESAFEGCSILKSVKLGTAVTTIGKQAFMGCKKLSFIALPEKVMKIKEKAFYNCSSLKKVTVKSKVLSSVGKSAFKKCKKNIVFSVPSEKVSAYSRLLKGKY